RTRDFVARGAQFRSKIGYSGSNEERGLQIPMNGARKVTRTTLLLGLAAAMSGCASSGAGSGASMLGGFAARENGGNRAAQSIVTAMGGGLVSGPLGARLDDGDRRKGLEAEYRALEYTPA